MTEFAWVDDSGIERLRGTIDPEPGGVPAEWTVAADGGPLP